jgi:hypothetical protein
MCRVLNGDRQCGQTVGQSTYFLTMFSYTYFISIDWHISKMQIKGGVRPGHGIA